MFYTKKSPVVPLPNITWSRVGYSTDFHVVLRHNKGKVHPERGNVAWLKLFAAAQNRIGTFRPTPQRGGSWEWDRSCTAPIAQGSSILAQTPEENQQHLSARLARAWAAERLHLTGCKPTARAPADPPVLLDVLHQAKRVLFFFFYARTPPANRAN